MGFDDPLPDDIKLADFFLYEKPTTRREWARNIYDVVFAIEGSTMSWDKHNIQIIEEAVRYFKTYKMLSLVWWTERLIKQISSNGWDMREGDSVRLTVNNLRGILHDEWFRPEKINDDEFSIRGLIKKEFVNLRDI